MPNLINGGIPSTPGGGRLNVPVEIPDVIYHQCGLHLSGARGTTGNRDSLARAWE